MQILCVFWVDANSLILGYVINGMYDFTLFTGDQMNTMGRMPEASLANTKLRLNRVLSKTLFLKKLTRMSKARLTSC